MKKAKTLNEPQFKNLLAITEAGQNGLRNKAILILSYYCGLRAKELAALKISDVLNQDDKLKNELQLIKAYTKGEKHRTIYLTNHKVKTALNAYLTARKEKEKGLRLTAPLFKSQKQGHFSPNAMVQVLNNLYKKAGADYDGCSSHSGRRSLITKLINQGTSINKVKEIAGHSNINTTMEYVDTDPVDLANIMKKI